MLIERIPEIAWPLFGGLSMGVIFISLDIISKLFGMAGVAVSVGATLWKLWKDHKLKLEIEEIKAARQLTRAELEERLQKVEDKINGQD